MLDITMPRFLLVSRCNPFLWKHVKNAKRLQNDLLIAVGYMNLLIKLFNLYSITIKVHVAP